MTKSARPQIGRTTAEAIGFSIAAVVVAFSAAQAKQNDAAPVALAAVDHVTQPEAVIAASPEVAPVQPVTLDASDPDIRYINGRAVRPVRTFQMKVTAYSPDQRSCGNFADGITASGKSIWTNGMKLVAADTRDLPFGTLLSIPGYDNGQIVPVLDRGGAIKGSRLDVLYPSHALAREWGVQNLPITVWEYVD